ncbi:ATP-binding cassette subfamily B protein [Herbihabitans rhizosphaerae]|uniref:ATP-binding cassette subfamily B protein n=1 Tax=Herbihabitans rhizosphaerae TaxID=1872711 RepID=A0A4Q7L6X1_9PSEU|nr:ABC transporter ATP-binding protein [Herbihabitans rhizosphaerae]RZS45026.1 ATP-binding cassette subfamily B protein [Herbihabitans rhizosphaerae]
MTAAPPRERPVDQRPTARTAVRIGFGELMRPVRGQLAVAVAVQAVSCVAAVVPFAAVAELGRVLLTTPVDRQAVWTIAVIAAGALVLRTLLLLAAGCLSHLADVTFQHITRRRLAAHLGTVPLGWFTASNSGTVKKAVADDVQALHHLVAHTLLDLTNAVVMPATAIAYLLAVDWRMTVICLVPLALGALCYFRAMGGYAEQMIAFDQALSKINSSVVELVRGITVIKTFGRTERGHARFRRSADDFATFFLAWVRAKTAISATADLLLSPVVMLTTVLIAGTILIESGTLAAVDVLPFALLGLGLSAPMLAIGTNIIALRASRQAAERITTVLSTPALAEPAEPRTIDDTAVDGTTVEFRDLRFTYDGGTEALRGIDLELRPNTVTALVGPSGSGKSTLARMLPRFWDPTEGAVTIGGVDLRDLDPNTLYRTVSFVFQDVQLLNTSVRDNIALARPDATLDEIVAVAKAAEIHDRISELPSGYDAVVGTDVQLSGGEAQRVSIARALLADTPVLVLDEATAFVDPEAEVAIQRALSRLARGRTLLVIAHRLATIRGSDQIVVLDNGNIAEQGTHDDLLARDGRYAGMWHAQQEASAKRGGLR